jgi:predicted amidohydrolase
VGPDRADDLLDVRFPALYRALPLKPARRFLRYRRPHQKDRRSLIGIRCCARAIENGCFVFAAAQCGITSKRETTGIR